MASRPASPRIGFDGLVPDDLDPPGEDLPYGRFIVDDQDMVGYHALSVSRRTPTVDVLKCTVRENGTWLARSTFTADFRE